MIRAGNLRHVITIERKVESKRSSGSVVAAWQHVATVRAEIVTATADEFLTGYGEAEAGTIVFRAWWRPGIDIADRVMHAGKVYDIKAVAEIGLRRMLEIRAVATS